MHKFTLSFSIAITSLLAACSSHPLSQGRAFKLSETSFSDLPGWEDEDFTEALPALQRACIKPTDSWRSFCDGLSSYRYASAPKIRRYIERHLTPYQVTAYGEETGKITGYYEAELTGTRNKVHANQVPVYGLPYDYVRDKKIETREEIESDADFEAPVIAWADDPVDLFILHIQGSGRMETPDGEIRLGYAGNNGRTFKGIGSILAEEGLLSETGRSMPEIRRWLKSHPDQARDLMAQNPRYIFFREVQGETPVGTAGVPLTPHHSVAVDKNYIPMQTPMWLVTQDPDDLPIRHLVVAQDTGNAIKGGIRADYFWGHGEEAFTQAGRMNQQGSYYLLLPD